MSGHLLLFCLISVTAVTLAGDTVHQDIIKYIGQIQIIRGMLAAESCVDPFTHVVDTREILGSGNHLYDIELEVQKKQYQRLRAVLIECRSAASRPTMTATFSTTPRSPTTMKTTITTTTTLRPSTPTPLPAMCLSATNLTEGWRQDHKGSQMNGARNCDTKEMIAAGRPWFRFSGAAGNRLMNKCVPRYSCGTVAALWSDDPMPTQVGAITQVNVYGRDGDNCRYPSHTQKISVVRCSTSGNDYVYRYDGPDYCYYGFCGMSV